MAKTKAFLSKEDEQEIVQAIDGHLCRCGAHNRVVRAIEKAAARLAAA